VVDLGQFDQQRFLDAIIMGARGAEGAHILRLPLGLLRVAVGFYLGTDVTLGRGAAH
jgi:hypothetical protein